MIIDDTEEFFNENNVKYTRKVSVRLGDSPYKEEIASMLRGLMCQIEGWGVISGLTNKIFSSEDGVILRFSSRENAKYFKECADYFFSEEVLNEIRVSRRILKK